MTLIALCWRLTATPACQGRLRSRIHEGDISAADIAETLLWAQRWCKEQVEDALPQGCNDYLELCWPNIRGPTQAAWPLLCRPCGTCHPLAHARPTSGSRTQP